MLRADALADAPRLRKFARRATRYENAYAQATYTVPSHMTLLTGLDPFAHAALDNGVPAARRAPLLSERLRAAGYQTAAFTDGFVDAASFGAGFDAFENDQGDFRKPTGDNFARAAAWLAARRAPDRPFFLFVHSYVVHDHFRDARGVRRSASEAYFAGEARLEKTYRASYRAAVREADRRLGALLAALPPDAAVLVTSDHGENILEPHAGDFDLEHTMPWEPALRVPLIARAPGQTDGESVGCVAPLGESATTLAEWAGLPAGGPRLPRAGEPCRPPLFFFLGRRDGLAAGVRRGADKLIVEFPRGGGERARLFDAQADPGETRELSAERPAAARELRALLAARFEETGFDPRRPRPEPDAATAEALRRAGYLR